MLTSVKEESNKRKASASTKCINIRRLYNTVRRTKQQQQDQKQKKTSLHAPQKKKKSVDDKNKRYCDVVVAAAAVFDNQICRVQKKETGRFVVVVIVVFDAIAVQLLSLSFFFSFRFSLRQFLSLSFYSISALFRNNNNNNNNVFTTFPSIKIKTKKIEMKKNAKKNEFYLYMVRLITRRRTSTFYFLLFQSEHSLIINALRTPIAKKKKNFFCLQRQ